MTREEFDHHVQVHRGPVEQGAGGRGGGRGVGQRGAAHPPAGRGLPQADRDGDGETLNCLTARCLITKNSHL